MFFHETIARPYSRKKRKEKKKEGKLLSCVFQDCHDFSLYLIRLRLNRYDFQHLSTSDKFPTTDCRCFATKLLSNDLLQITRICGSDYNGIIVQMTWQCLEWHHLFKCRCLTGPFHKLLYRARARHRSRKT